MFVQNEASLKLLQTIGVQQVSVSGDTRFDRVGAAKKPLAFMDTFVGARKCIIAGIMPNSLASKLNNQRNVYQCSN